MSIARKSDAGISKLEREIEELEKQNQETSQKETSEGVETEETPREVPNAEEKTEERREENPSVPSEDEGNQLEKDKTDWKKRFGDLRRYSQKTEDENKRLKEQLALLEGQTKAGNPGVPPLEPDQIKEWMEKYPQVAAIITNIAEEKTSERFSEIESLKTLQEEIAREREEAVIRKSHPDFDDIVGSDAFHDWADTQPEPVQNALYKGSASEVVWGLSLYKKEQGISSSTNDIEAARSVTKSKTSEPSGSTKGRWSESKVEKMSEKDFEEHWPEIQKAQREGKFVYDLSGGAR